MKKRFNPQSRAQIISNGLLRNNPVFRLVLGTCPTLALSSAAMNGIYMGLATTFVLVCSNVMIALLRKVIPDKVRIPAYVLIIATFVTLVDMILDKFLPNIYEILGLYIPLIVVNCIILARAESFASMNTVGDSALDGLGMGFGFMFALVLIGMVREFFGAGTLFGFELGALTNSNFPMAIISMAPGGFLVYGLLMAAINQIQIRKNSKAARQEQIKNALKPIVIKEGK